MDFLSYKWLKERLDFIDQSLAVLTEKVQTVRQENTDRGVKIMALMDDVLQDQTDTRAVIDGMATLLDTIHQELEDMISTGATPQKLQSLRDMIAAERQAAQDAVARNPDPAVQPPPGP